MTKREKSCGGVIFTREGDELRYIVIRQTNDICCFPKGHMEAGESEEETAVREIKEETGLDVTLKDGFRECDAYRFTIDGEDVILKDVVYFLGEFNAQTPVPQKGELTEIYLLPYDEARAKLQFEASRKILDRADKFLKTK